MSEINGTPQPALTTGDWMPDVRTDEADRWLESAVGQAIGAASMCWHTRPTGVFDSDAAAWVADGLVKYIRNRGGVIW